MGRLTTFAKRMYHAWNAFDAQETDPRMSSSDIGPSYTYPQNHQTRFRSTVNGKTIVEAIYTRIAIDTASIPIRHIRRDDNGQYQEDMDSALNECLTVQANVDQGSRAFVQDAVQSMLEEGVAALLPVDTTLNPLETGGYDVVSMRVGRVLQWYPRNVQIRAYDDDPLKGGIQKDVTVPKGMVAIVENPLYSVMNERSSTLQRLLRKLSLLDAIDEQSASGKLDLIIQLPYVVRTTTKREEAAKRMKEIEFQLKGSQYGIAYTDGTEKITQLNRPAENNLMAQVEYLTKMLYGQLGLTEEVMNGTADEPTMINYYNRTVEPILGAISQAMIRSFLTKTARSQGQWIMYFRDPFKLVPVKDLAEIADKLTRNEIVSANEFRSFIGIRPSKDPKANQLRNSNVPQNDPANKPPDRSPAPAPSLLKPLLSQLPDHPQLQGVNGQNGSS